MHVFSSVIDWQTLKGIPRLFKVHYGISFLIMKEWPGSNSYIWDSVNMKSGQTSKDKEVNMM